MLRNISAFVLLCVLALAPVARAQAKSGTRANVIDELKKLDHKWLEAERTRNVAYYRKFFAPSYVLVLASGKMYTKDEWLAELSGPDHATLQAIYPHDIKVHLYKNVAILTDHTTIRGHDSKGNSMNGEFVVFRVLIKQDGAWRATGVVMNRLQAK